MKNETLSRQQLLETINQLPDLVMPELAVFVEYLAYKNSINHQIQLSPETKHSDVNFLLSIAGIGKTEEDDLAEKDEEILSQEINQSGWGK